MRKLKFLPLLLALLTLAGCGRRVETTSTLWVVTEQTKPDGMNSQVKQKIEAFETAHPGTEVKLDILPREVVAREQYLKQVRTEIMSGKGPDVYLLPTTSTFLGNGLDEAPRPHQITDLKPLFPNVEQAARNGLFLDLSARYDADDALEKQKFQSTVMEAGVMDTGSRRDGRYLPPLRYNFPVLYADADGLAEYGLTADDLSGSVLDLMELAVHSGSQTLACAVEPHVLLTGRGFSFLSQAIDYEAQRPTVSKEEIARLLRLCQQLEALVGGESDQRVPINVANLNWPMIAIDPDNSHVNGGYEESLRPMRNFPYEFPMRLGSLEDSVLLCAIDKKENWQMKAIPVWAMDGDPDCLCQLLRGHRGRKPGPRRGVRISADVPV